MQFEGTQIMAKIHLFDQKIALEDISGHISTDGVNSIIFSQTSHFSLYKLMGKYSQNSPGSSGFHRKKRGFLFLVGLG